VRDTPPPSQPPVRPSKVALKRVGDVLNSPENAKRVLREVGASPARLTVSCRSIYLGLNIRIPTMHRTAHLHSCPPSLAQVCIMRRLVHPGIVRLRDVFVRPSSTGVWETCNSVKYCVNIV